MVGQIEKMDIDPIKDVPEAIIAEKDGQDRIHKFKRNSSCKELVVFDKEVSNDGICHHDSVVRNVASFVDYHGSLEKLRNNSELSSRAFLSEEASIS